MEIDMVPARNVPSYNYKQTKKNYFIKRPITEKTNNKQTNKTKH